MPFYTFSQNNSGGRFRGPEYVIIEAGNAGEANRIAVEDADIYFDGCYKGIDCDCCGDRWHPAYEDEGTETPEIYGEDARHYKGFSSRASIVIYYLNGDVVFIGTKRGD